MDRARRGRLDVAGARPFTLEPRLFAAPLVRRRDGRWAFIDFRDPYDFYILDPSPFAP